MDELALAALTKTARRAGEQRRRAVTERRNRAQPAPVKRERDLWPL